MSSLGKNPVSSRKIDYNSEDNSFIMAMLFLVATNIVLKKLGFSAALVIKAYLYIVEEWRLSE